MSMKSGSPRRRRVLSTALVGLAIGMILIAVEVKQGAPISSAIGGSVILVVYAVALVAFQTRSETISTLAGNPVDERWGLIHARALGTAANIGAVVAIGGFVVMEAMGRDAWQFALMVCVIGLGYAGGVVWYRRRL